MSETEYFLLFIILKAFVSLSEDECVYSFLAHLYFYLYIFIHQ